MATLFDERISMASIGSGNRYVMRPKNTCELFMMADQNMEDSSAWTPTNFTYNSAAKRWEYDADAQAFGILEQSSTLFNKAFRSTTAYRVEWTVESAATGITTFQLTTTLTGASVDLTTDDLGASGFAVGTHTKTFQIATITPGNFQLGVADTAGTGVLAISYMNIQEVPWRQDNSNIRSEEWFKIPVRYSSCLLLTHQSRIIEFTDNASTYSSGNRLMCAAYGVVTEDNDLLSVPHFTRSDFAYTNDTNDQRHYRLNVVKSTGASVVPWVVPYDVVTGAHVSIVAQELMQRTFPALADPVVGQYNSSFWQIMKKNNNNDDWGTGTTQQPFIPSVAGLAYVYAFLGFSVPGLSAGNWTSLTWDLKIASGGK